MQLNYGLILAMSFVVLVSGCTAVERGDGVQIKNFEADFSPVLPLEEITFHARVKNVGSFVAEGVEAQILGLESWGQAGPNEDECSPGFSLIAPDVFYGVEGETRSCSWTFRAPEAVLPVTYDATLRVYYNYKASTVKEVTIFSRNELTTLQQQGRSLPTETKGVTRGPISLDLESKPPIVLTTSSLSFPVIITVSNVGGGVVCPENTDCRDPNLRNKIVLDVRASEGIFTECDDLELDLFKGENTVTCRFTADFIPSSGSVKRTVEVASAFSYFVEKTIPITVKPPE